MLFPNLKDVVDLSTPIPVGTYNGRVDEVKVTNAKSSGNPQLEASLTVFDDSNPNAVREMKRTYYAPLTGKAANFPMLLRACGFKAEGDAAAAGELAEFDEQRLLGCEVRVKIKHDEYEGEARDKIGALLVK